MLVKYFKVLVISSWMCLLLLSGYYVLSQDFSFNSTVVLLESYLKNIRQSGWGWTVPLVFIFVFTVRPILLIPSLVMNIVAYAIFGAVEGFFWVLIAEQTSALSFYIFVRYLAGASFKNGILSLAKKMRIDTHSHPRKQFYLVCVLRLASLPFDFVTAFCALSHIRIQPFLAGTAVVSVPWIALFFILASKVQQGSWFESSIGFIVFAGFIFIGGVLARKSGLILSKKVTEDSFDKKS
jgi:uncharacterized membrane protein YdjX (TVP38/TMEM64 family)